MQPTEEWVPEPRQININADKIKASALKMDLPMPAWMQDEQMLAKRVYELFGGSRKEEGK